MSTCASCLHVGHGACPQDKADPARLACPNYRYKNQNNEPLPVDSEVERPDPQDTQKIVDATVVSEQPSKAVEDNETEAADDATIEGSPIELEYFGERAAAAIKALGVTTYEELAAVPRGVIDVLPNCGDATIKEVKDVLLGLGFAAASE